VGHFAAVTSLQCQQLRHLRYHVLTVENLENVWSFPLYLRHLSWGTDCLRFTPGDPGHDQITGGRGGGKKGLFWTEHFPDYWRIRYNRIFGLPEPLVTDSLLFMCIQAYVRAQYDI
jgi:hypothetical protein